MNSYPKECRHAVTAFYFFARTKPKENVLQEFYLDRGHVLQIEILFSIPIIYRQLQISQRRNRQDKRRTGTRLPFRIDIAET